MESLPFHRGRHPRRRKNFSLAWSAPVLGGLLAHGTFFLHVSDIILITGVVCSTLNFALHKINISGPKTRSKKYHTWQICIFFAQFTLIHSQQREDQFFFSQSYKGGPCPAQRRLLSGHASCTTSDIPFYA